MTPPLPRARTQALLGLEIACKAAAFLPLRFARPVLDRAADIAFGAGEGIEYTDTNGRRVEL